MTRARKESMACQHVETHHVWSRCVQRAMLCGQDPVSGEDYSHRRRVLRDLVRYQANVFAVDVGNYSVMGNHFHMILRSRPDIVSSWSDEECAWRYRLAWPSLYQGKWGREPADSVVEEVLANPRQLERARSYLSSISGFLARVKEPAAKRFNAEMKTKGHYWEGRFGNRRLNTQEETIGCSLYVDLNHVKAGAAESLISSDTSAIQDRLLAEQMRIAWADENSAASLKACLDDVEGEVIVDEEFLLDLFRDCWLAPITTDSPLAVEETQKLRLKPSEDDECEVASNSQQPPPLSSQRKSLGRPKVIRTKELHRRYRQRLKQRKSDRCFIDTAWSIYRRTAMHLANEIIKSRPKRRKAENPQRTTASTWSRDVNQFLKSLGNVISCLCRVGVESSPSELGVAPRPPD